VHHTLAIHVDADYGRERHPVPAQSSAGRRMVDDCRAPLARSRRSTIEGRITVEFVDLPKRKK
jgi:hypothetical protein